MLLKPLKSKLFPAHDAVLVRGRWQGSGPVLDFEVKQGRILRRMPADASTPDFGGAGAVLSPPLFDAQVNGAGGVDLQSPELDEAALDSMAKFLERRGVARWIPTLITNSLDAMEYGCRVLVQAMASNPALRRAMPGIHLEGPFISPVDGPRGAHPLQHVRNPDWRAFRRLLKAAEGKVLYTTLAPELPGAVPFIRRAVAEGVVVSLGHHQATAVQVRAATDAGATLCTHLGNGLQPLLPRHHNPLWPQLDDQRLRASVISDLHHLPPEVLRVIARAKGPGNLLLVSDCTALTGEKAGRYTSFGREVELCKDGAIRIPGTTMLAGSANTLDECVARAVACGALDWPQAIRAATRTPAAALGISSKSAPSVFLFA